jgi:hypothetical protein
LIKNPHKSDSVNSTKYSNDEEDLPRAVRLMRYNSQMHSVAGDPLGEVFYPAAQVGGVQRAGAEVRRWQWPSYRRKVQEAHWRKKERRFKIICVKIDSSGQVLVSLSHHLTSNKLTISPIALRDIIVREKSKELQGMF